MDAVGDWQQLAESPVSLAAHEAGVVATGERAVERRTDAGIGLCAGDNEPTDTPLFQLGLQRGVLE